MLHMVGAGSIGCVWAAQHAIEQQESTLLLRNRQKVLQYQQQGGCILYTEAGNTQRLRVNATSPEQLTAPLTQVVITTKAYDVASALATLTPYLNEQTDIILLQNGLGSQQAALAQLPNHRLWAATTTDGAFMHAPFHVERAGFGTTWYGPLSPQAQHSHWRFPDALGNIQLHYTDDILHKLWCKVAINAAINPLTVLYQCQNGTLVENPDYFAHVLALCREIELIAAAQAQPLFERPLVEAVAEVATATRENYSSMLQDVRHQRTTEIEEITGFICAQAAKNGVAAPLNTQLRTHILSLHHAHTGAPHG